MDEVPAERVIFITDIEGSWQALARSIACLQGRGLRVKVPDSDLGSQFLTSGPLELDPGWALVIGGDLTDRGAESRRIVRALLELKRACPQRCHLLLGNRDIGKIRLTSELATDQLAFADMPRPSWRKDAAASTLAQFLERCEAPNTAGMRLRWFLKCTSGAERGFAFRREELQRECGGDLPSDDAVVASFLDDLAAPHGALRELLHEGVLAYLHPSSGTLFVHGGVVGTFRNLPQHVLGVIPGRAGRVRDVAQWVAKLNEWKDLQLAEWERDPQFFSPQLSAIPYDPVVGTRRGGDALISYAQPNSPWPSCVAAKGAGIDRETRAPKAFPANVNHWLVSSGVRRVCSGHTPQGDTPTLVRGEHDTLMILADTSHSDLKAPDSRGIAAAAVVVHGETTEVCGQCSDGTEYSYFLPQDPWVGEWLLDGRLVKARLSTPSSNCLSTAPKAVYLVARWQGYQIKHERLTLEDLAAIGKATRMEHTASCVSAQLVRLKTTVSVVEGPMTSSTWHSSSSLNTGSDPKESSNSGSSKERSSL
ncbi:hypothetical protein CYMTET_8331 [Cymbomonas tetramitiformis]|uniref:Calcineurin-like phosphoesterase domain-containing protein n=1 Tax=Cymbomonas tetramitiformis TaxID=36881 RepID=A0AAE0LFY7_9CHLO|nr:hypothetical protein CYMTET_8331 [Cymbomonas tetramitiformis]|eukprot:gene22286-26886_t